MLSPAKDIAPMKASEAKLESMSYTLPERPDDGERSEAGIVGLGTASEPKAKSEQLTAEFGKGFDKSNLRKIRQFHCTFSNRGWSDES